MDSILVWGMESFAEAENDMNADLISQLKELTDVDFLRPDGSFSRKLLASLQ